MTRRILCVCHGNTCRSPMAQGVLEALAREAGLPVEVDSAGTAPRGSGVPPDPRALTAAAARGYDIAAQRTRAVAAGDFARFDLVLAMDRATLDALARLRPPGPGTAPRLLDPQGRDIADPFAGGPADYARALDLIEAAARDLIAELAPAPGQA
ncbi:low molecular weight phosphotyrosine protein phosphatase [Limibaculum sp. M0105]|uniref:protein-tyrosine-phosphatase n=1 Tax=Thermohalobaculum xanthum TaxID=2753746 RepID=A0A8J7M8X3_9RHOB|nr:low molecular weight protein-tyrosine-phosphatase [Thermohalobaculum xanthum]MBK0400819.1 low molecular weight phosphotyrosine protein phosphatase [Thermohalobaculum xanthum]